MSEPEKVSSETVIGAGSFTLGELAKNIRRAGRTEPGRERPCRRCKKPWTPSGWNFYDLCDACFREFDTQKMRGRLWPLYKAKALPAGLFPPEWAADGEPAYYSESVEQWMKDFPADEPAGGSP